ncbi:hypothetical protein LXL04_036785 [Taraxacum kok-saghyz]
MPIKGDGVNGSGNRFHTEVDGDFRGSVMAINGVGVASTRARSRSNGVEKRRNGVTVRDVEGVIKKTIPCVKVKKALEN